MQPHKETHCTWPSFSTIAKVACLVVPVIAYLGRGFITGPACIEWNKDVRKAEYWASKQKEWYDTSLNTYLDRAELNCNWEFIKCIPFFSFDQETLEFCSRRHHPNMYPIEKIPSVWEIKDRDSSDRDHCNEPEYGRSHRLAGMELTCYAQDVRISRSEYLRCEKIFNNTLAAKPLLCSRFEKV
jgi:hypothetical protein